MRKAWFEILFFIGVLTLFVSLIFGAISTLNAGAEDIEMLQTFNLDEGSGTWQLLQNVQNEDFDPRGFYYYGYSYFSLTHLMVKAIGFVGFDTSKEGFLAVFLRFVSLFSWFLCFLLSFGIGKNLKWSNGMSILAAAAICFMPKFYEYAQFVHPDTLQQAFALAGIYALTRWSSLKGILLSALFLGLAFGTKYSGIFLLPLAYLALFFWFREGKISRQKMLYGIFGILAVFFLAWFIFNPTFFSNLDAVQADLNEQMSFVRRGNHQTESPNPLLWFSVIQTQTSYILSSLLIAGLLLAFFHWKSKGFLQKDLLPWLMLVVFVIGMIYLMMAFQMRRPRYMFHLFPLLIFASFHFLEIKQATLQAFPRRLTFLYAMIGLIFMALTAMRGMEHRQNPEANSRIQAGLWLAKEYPSDVRIISDYYSYIPKEKFPNSWHVFGMLPQDVVNFDPDILVINKKLSGARSWKKEGSRFSDLDFEISGKDQAQEYAAFHRWLYSDDCPFKPIYEVNDILILEKEKSLEGQASSIH